MKELLPPDELLAEIKARHAEDIEAMEKDPTLLEMECWRTPADIAALIKMVEEATADDWPFCSMCGLNALAAVIDAEVGT